MTNRLSVGLVLKASAYLVVLASFGLMLFAYLGRLPAVDHPLDDAYISFRYAVNSAAGYWLQWNRGEAPSEGFTNLSLVALLAMGVRLGVDPAIGALVINVVSTLAVAVGVLLLGQNVRRGLPSLALIAVALWLGDSRTAYSTGTGLETQFNVFLLIAQLILVWSLIAKSRGSVAVLSALVSIFAGLTRPESAVLCALAYVPVAIALLYRRDFSTLGLSVGLYVLLGLAYLGWKLAFFGYVFPNAFYIKSVDPRELVGLGPVLEFARYNWLVLSLALLSIPVLIWRGFTLQVLSVLLPLIFGAAYFSTVLHEMAPHFRYEAPIYAYATSLAAVGLHVFAPRSAPMRAAVLVVTLVCVWAAIFVARTPGKLPRTRTVAGPPMAWFECGGKALGSTGLGQDAVLHTGSSGRLPYESGFYHVDIGAGIVDNTLCGRNPVTLGERVAYVRQYPVDVLFSGTPPAVEGTENAADDAAFLSPYVQEVTLGNTNSFSILRQYRLRGYDHDRRSQSTWNSMKRLRDEFIAVGRSPLETRAGNRQYAYVSRTSKHKEALIGALRPCYSLSAAPDESVDSTSSPTR